MQKGPVKFSKCIKELTVKKSRAIAEKYLRDHPEDHHYGMAALFLKAVVDFCPEKSLLDFI
jgi:hypothetical protein